MKELNAILKKIRARVGQNEKRNVIVYFARETDEETKSLIRTKFRESDDIKFEIDQTILGGFRIKIDKYQIIDASVKSQIKGIKTNIIENLEFKK